jgi:micrococcal nuclease
MQIKLITNKKKMILALIFIISTSLSGITLSSNLNGKIIKIIDGDTVYFQANNDDDYKKLRLVGIDAPEMKQPFGQESRQCLANLINNKMVQIITYGEDRYKRTLAKIIIEKIDINQAMIKNGCAWFYRRYKNTLGKDDQVMYDKAEIFAIENKKGLFSNQEAEAPWVWRKKY